ncbi:hypothetical protein VTN02DRAFT_3727 [Thermoascus thermophilus]
MADCNCEEVIQEISDWVQQVMAVVHFCTDFPEFQESLGDAYYDLLVQMRSVLDALEQINGELMDLVQERLRDEAGFDLCSKL